MLGRRTNSKVGAQPASVGWPGRTLDKEIHLSDPTSFFQAQALPGPREKNIDAD